MASAGLQVSGLKEVQAMLTGAPKNIVMLAYGRACRAGITVIARDLLSRTPVRQGDLARAMVIDTVVDTNAKGAYASVGFGKQGHVAYWLEYGHVLVSHKPRKRPIGIVAARPFMRPAFDSSGDAAIEAFCTALSETLKLNY